eukprot:gene37741-45850_t
MIATEIRKFSVYQSRLQKEVANAIQKNEEEADKANAIEMRHMIANVAHDLKTPLSSFLAGIEYISQVITEMQVKQRMSAGVLSAVDIEDCIQSKLMHEAEGSPASRKARSSIKGRSSIIELKGDASKRRRSVENNSVNTVVLTHNANWIQKSRSSDSRGSVDTTAFDDDHTAFLRVEVEDHGIGLSEEMMQTLFSPFKQAQRLAGGTGLGLFSLANRVQALGGKCGVDKRRDGGEGSMFWFTIPYQPDRTAAQQGPKRRRSSMALSHASSSLSDGQNDPLVSSKTINVIGATSSLLSSPLRTLDPITSNGGSAPSSSPASSDSNAANVDVQMQPPPPPLPPLSVGSDNGVETFRSHESGASGEKSGTAEVPSVTHDQGIAMEEDMKTLRILLVDDSPAILKMASMMLRRHKHSVHTATNGAEAVKRIQENLNSSNDSSIGAASPYDVVLIDLQMPIMDGLEAMRRIRKLEQAASSKFSNVIIGMSANSDEETTAEAYGAGADAFMTKPFSLDTFYDTYDGVMVLKEEELQKSAEGTAEVPAPPC